MHITIHTIVTDVHGYVSSSSHSTSDEFTEAYASEIREHFSWMADKSNTDLSKMDDEAVVKWFEDNEINGSNGDTIETEEYDIDLPESAIDTVVATHGKKKHSSAVQKYIDGNDECPSCGNGDVSVRLEESTSSFCQLEHTCDHCGANWMNTYVISEVVGDGFPSETSA